MHPHTVINVDMIIHATENISKFLNVFEDVFGVSEKYFTKQNLYGHFDNPIILLNLKLTKKNATDFFKKLVSKIPLDIIDSLVNDIENRVEDSTLHFRLDKEEFVKKNFIMAEKNAIKIRIYTPIYSKKEIPEIFSELLRPN